MPFDALVATRSPLSEALERLGITPVSNALLAAHKQVQQEKYGPSFWYRHPGFLMVALMAAVTGMAVTSALSQGLARLAPSLPCYVSFAWLCLIALPIVTGLFRQRAGSHWEERRVPVTGLDGLGVPAPIAALARQVRTELPSATLIYGELVQEHVVLDPYLLVAHGTERVCLGIWEGKKVIAVAQVQPLF
jgi:hypothetical protein